MIRILRVRKRETLIRPEIVGLIQRAVTATKYPGLTWPVLAAELARLIDQPNIGFYIAQQDDAPKALVLVILPTSALMIAPQVVLVYSEGRPALVKALGRAMKKWLQDEGHDRVMGVTLWREDGAFERRFRYLGKPRRIGTLMDFQF